MDAIKRGDQVKLLHPYKPLIGRVSGTTYSDPLKYQIECDDGTSIPYAEATQLERLEQ